MSVIIAKLYSNGALLQIENLGHFLFNISTICPFLFSFLSGNETRGADYRAVPDINGQGFIGREVIGGGVGGRDLAEL